VLGFSSLGVLTLVGCPQILAIDGPVTVAPGAEAGSRTCGFGVSAPACEACLNAHCCDEMTACGMERGCASYESCLLGCSDYACRAACRIGNPGGQSFPEIPALDVCVVTHCEAECGVNCGMVEANAEVDAATTCQACIGTTNCAAAEACGRSLDCTEVLQCTRGCVANDCKEACENGRDAGALLKAFVDPLEQACMSPCGYGENWDCVGQVALPAGNGVTTRVTITVTTLGGAVVPGLTAKACARSDLDCSGALDTGVTDDAGVVTLSVRGLAVGPGFDGYFDFAPSAATVGVGTTIVPFLSFVSYSYGEPSLRFTATVLTRADLDKFTAAGGVDAGDAGPAGDLVLFAFDCAGELAPGVTFNATSTAGDLSSQIRYVAGVAPSPSATATGSTGIALLFGAPAGQQITISYAPAALGRPAGTAQVFTRANGYSGIGLVPR
jgi:hypothetical protein